MKLCYIVFKKLKELIQRNTFVFVLLCIGIFSCNLMFTYFYGNLKYSAEHSGHTVVEFYNTNDNTMTAKELSLQLLNFGVVDVNFASVNTNDLNMPENYTEEPIENSAYTLIRYNIREYAEIVPLIVSVEVSEKKDSIKTENLISFLQAQYGEEYTVEEMQIIDRDFWYNMAVVLLIYLSAVFSLLFLMTYLYEDAAYELQIYEMIGATRSQVVFVLSMIQFCILLLFGFLAQLFHYLFYDQIFAKIAWNEQVAYNFFDYIAVSMATVILVFVFVVSFVSYKVRGSAIEASRRLM